MLKSKLFFFNFFIFSFYFESFAMKENDIGCFQDGSQMGSVGSENSGGGEHIEEGKIDQLIINNSSEIPICNSISTNIIGNKRGLIRKNIQEENLNSALIHQQNIDMNTSVPVNLNNSSFIPIQKDEVDPSKKDKVNYFIVGSDKPLKKFNKLVHIFFYFVISPLLNINNLDWRHYFFQGQLNRGGVFFYYGLLNFGIGFNRKTFCDTCSCRIIGVNLFQFLGSFVLYFFVDVHEHIKDRWKKTSGSLLSFLLFNASYFAEYIESIDSERNVPEIVRGGSFMNFISYSFAMFPFLSFFTFDFQLFEYLSFSLNIGSFLFLTVAFFIYTFYRHTGKPFGNISGVVNKYHNTFKDSKEIELDTISLKLDE